MQDILETKPKHSVSLHNRFCCKRPQLCRLCSFCPAPTQKAPRRQPMMPPKRPKRPNKPQQDRWVVWHAKPRFISFFLLFLFSHPRLAVFYLSNLHSQHCMSAFDRVVSCRYSRVISLYLVLPFLPFSFSVVLFFLPFFSHP